MLTQLRDDLRYSIRVAACRPWLSLTVITTMVLGIGATTAVFSIIDALLLRRSPSRRPSSWSASRRPCAKRPRRWS